MQPHSIVSRERWLEARRELLAEEKELTRLRDALSRQRRALPWVRVDKAYAFEGPNGKETLGELFGVKRQLIVYHFMFGPDWESGCKSCSFWADNFNGIVSHLEQRDATLVAISRAPLARLQDFAARLGWTFKWLSSLDSDFNFDYGVSFTQETIATGRIPYNYAIHEDLGTEMPGISVFYRDEDGSVYHTYSCYSRGLDMMNTAYHYLDLLPKGRDEDELPYTMAWVSLRDEYDT